jgi:hypothetical protein
MASVQELHSLPGVAATPDEATRGFIFQQVRPPAAPAAAAACCLHQPAGSERRPPRPRPPP